MKQSVTKNGNPVVYFGLTEGKEYDLREGGRASDFVGKISFIPKGAKEAIEMVFAVRNKTMRGDNGKDMLLAKLVVLENKESKRFGK